MLVTIQSDNWTLQSKYPQPKIVDPEDDVFCDREARVGQHQVAERSITMLLVSQSGRIRRGVLQRFLICSLSDLDSEKDKVCLCDGSTLVYSTS